MRVPKGDRQTVLHTRLLPMSLHRELTTTHRAEVDTKQKDWISILRNSDGITRWTYADKLVLDVV